MSKKQYEKIMQYKRDNQNEFYSSSSGLTRESMLSQQDMHEMLANSELAYLVIESGKKIVLHQNSTRSKQEIYVFVEKDAVCVLHNFEKESVLQRHIVYHIVLEENAQCTMNFAILYAQQTTYEISVYAKGSRAKAQINGLYALANEQQASVKTYQYHDAPDTQSHVLIKGMVKDRSQACYKGLIVLDHGSEQAIAGQENKNIVLSKEAKIVSVPSIEVLQHNVQCSHGSAIGKFDKQAEWYLQSKGLSLQRLKELLIQTFFDPVLEGYDQKDAIVEVLCKKMV